jgi:hypothetical protein
MALTNFKKEEPINDHSLLCSVNGCGNLWSVRLEGSPPKCSHHQWGAKPKNEGTMSYKQWADRQPLSKPVADWYKQPDQQKGEW